MAEFFIFALVAFSIGAVLIGISQLLGRKFKGIRKNDIYESGMDPKGEALRRYDIKFYLTAILFLIFDVEIVFLYPWAIYYLENKGSTFLMAEFLFFMAILLVAFFFFLFSNSLKWEE